MNWSRSVYLAILALFLVPPAAHAQSSFELMEGERVRFKIEGASKYQTARVMSMSQDSVTFFIRGHEVPVALDDVTAMQRSVGTKTHELAGLLIGTAVGATVGLVAAAWADNSYSSSQDPYGLGAYYADVVDESVDLMSVLIGAGGGALVGLVIGTAVETDDWVSVPQPWTVGFSAHESGGSVALTIPLPGH